MKLIATTILSCAVVFGQSAFAEEHEVWIENKSFFPPTIHVQAGDTIRYINKTSSDVNVETADSDDNLDGYDSTNPCIDPDLYDGSSDGWATETIGSGEEIVVSVTTCMATDYEGTGEGYYQWQYNYYYGYWQQVYVQQSFDGGISFEAADLGL